MTTYLSIDVATKSLAIGLYEVGNLTKDSDLIWSEVVPCLMKVFDINDGQKVKETSIVTKAEALKKVLQEVDQSLVGLSNVVVLIEYQMNANHLSNAIFNMLVYHYANQFPVHIVKPSWKNTVALHSDLVLSNFLSKYSSNYQANKAHTKENMIYFLKKRDQLNMLQSIKKKNYDDIADTLCQCIAYALNV